MVLDSSGDRRRTTEDSLTHLPAVGGSDAVMPCYLSKGGVYQLDTLTFPTPRERWKQPCRAVPAVRRGGDVQKAQRLGQDGRSQGRVLLASPRQRLQQSNLCSLGRLHSKNCPPSLTITPLSVSSTRRRTELFSNNCSLAKFHQKK